LEVLRQHAQFAFVRAEDVVDLAQHLLHAHICARVARAVVTGEEEFQLIARLPSAARAQHPFEFRQLDQSADPSFKSQIHAHRVFLFQPAKQATA
jgi:hypothetical protein